MTTTQQSNIRLTDEQEAAVSALASLKHDVQTMGGYAGTGKTTVIRELTNRLEGFAVCAFTGKAAQVLRRKGVEATTIHSLIYRLVMDEYGERAVEPVEFELIPENEFTPRGIVIDEASMVPKAIYDDLCSLGVPLIFVGDHGQLEPVGGDQFNLMHEPQITLNKIHRNAGEIARFAEHLREGGDAQGWDSTGKVQVVDSGDFGAVQGIDDSTQMICAYNRTRCQLNDVVRESIFPGVQGPCIGDRIICLQNDRRAQVFNGMMGRIAAIDGRYLTFDTGDREIKMAYVPGAFGSETKPEYQRKLIPFDWAYCITCHKAQGDEWGHVVVVEQRCSKWDHRRWAYTAASRAKNRLTWVLE